MEPELVVPEDAARFLRLAQHDIRSGLDLKEALDDSMPGVLEKKTLLTMTHLWDAQTWKEHRSEWRWKDIVLKWPHSSVLRAMRVPFCGFLIWTVFVLAFNRALSAAGWFGPLTLPLAPLSLQAASIGLLVVFRNNQTHDRLKEAQRSLGGLGALGREIMQLLVVNVGVDSSREIAEEARLLALFGWALKCEFRQEERYFRRIVQTLNPDLVGWILERPHWAASVLLRLRAVVGALRSDGLLSSDAFKFIEERLAKLSAIDATCTRLATFPVPPSYHRQSSRAIILWLGSLPLVLEGLKCHPLQTLTAVACTTFVLLGVDQISMEVRSRRSWLDLG